LIDFVALLYNTTIIHLYHSRYTFEDFNFFIHLAIPTFDYYTLMVGPSTIAVVC